jgi:phage N-6-adenine-methyltransferase
MDRLSDQWETPPWLFEYLNRIFTFGWDACSTPENNLLGGYMDALHGDWPRRRPVYMNPPYSKPKPFLQKAYEESLRKRMKSL